MSNFLNENYVAWLIHYKSKYKDQGVQFIAGTLISELPKTKSISDMLSLLKQHIPTEPTTIYGPIIFLTQLTAWKKDLENVLSNYDNASQVIRKLNNDTKLSPLIRILLKQITEPKTQMHCKIQSLLSIICSEQFPDILDFLENLETAPPPESPQKGSFAAITPHNSDHAFCLGLLNNLAAKYNHLSELHSKSNSLLQSSLLICQDMYLIENNLNDELDEDQGICNICVLM